MTAPVIATDKLTKYYGATLGVADLDLEIQPGEVFGFLGPNGAGKTTAIRTILDLIHPTSGRALVFGLDSHKHSVAIKRRVGYLPGELELYKKMSGRELLKHFAALRGGVDWTNVEELASRFEYDMDKRVKALSSGNRHKLGLIQAFMHHPDLLILDEPTTGLDPLMQQEFYQLLLEAKGRGQTTFISSHILPEVERVCDRVGFIREGRLVDIQDVADLKDKAFNQLELHFAAPVPESDFIGLAGVRDVVVNEHVVRCTVAGSLDAVIKAAAQHEVVNLYSHEPNLEDIFMAYYGEGNNVS